MKKKVHVGIDIAKDSFDAAIAPVDVVPEDWAKLPKRHFPLSHDDPQARVQIEKWLGQVAENATVVMVGVESTGIYSKRFVLNMAPWPAAIVNPTRVKYYFKSLGNYGKDDRIDSAKVAVYTARRRPRAYVPATNESIRSLTRLRQQYAETMTCWTNRLEQTDESVSRRQINKTIAHLQKQIEATDRLIEKEIEKDAVLSQQTQALQAIPGIKKVVAPILSAELGDLTTYSRNQLSAAAGLNPIPNQSGKRNLGSRLAKGGGRAIRRALCLSARSLFQHKGPLGDHIRYLQEQGMSKPCIIGVMMRKLLLLARAVMKNGGTYDPSKIQYEGVR